MTEFIPQRAKADCAIAAIAMFTKLPYEEVHTAARKIKAYESGRGTGDCNAILRALGFRQANYITFDSSYITRQGVFMPIDYAHNYITGRVLRQVLWGRPALLSVRSLNVSAGTHAVYYDGLHLHDPQSGRRGKKAYSFWHEVEPREVIVWQHACCDPSNMVDEDIFSGDYDYDY